MSDRALSFIMCMGMAGFLVAIASSNVILMGIVGIAFVCCIIGLVPK